MQGSFPIGTETQISLHIRPQCPAVSAVAVHHGAELLFLGVTLCTQALAAFLHFGSKLCAKIFRFEYRADLDLTLALRIRATLHPLNRLFHRADLPNHVTGDKFLGFGEWPVDHGALIA